MRRVLACAAAALLWAAPARAAVSDYLGKPVGSVRLTIEDRETTDPSIAQIVETPVGQPLSMGQVRETVAHLISLGQFEDVRVDATLVNGAVALRYELAPVHPVTRIRFTGLGGASGVDENTLRRAIVDRFGSTPPLGRAAEMARIVAETLGQHGYLNAAVLPRAEVEHAPERATLVFDVKANQRTTVASVDVVGTPGVPSDEVVRRLGITVGAPYQRDTLNQRIERYVEDRRAHGYYEAAVVPTVRVDADGQGAHVTLAVNPGPHVRVVFTGDPIPGDRKADLVPVEQEGSVDEDLLEDSSNRIEDYFKSQGYRDAKAPHTREQSDGELVITFAIARGPLHRVASYEISGNASVPLADLQPNLRLREGQPFTDGRLDADVATIEEFYRRRGYATARARGGVEPQQTGDGPAVVPVTVRIVVSEGARTTVERIAFNGNAAIDDATLRGGIRLQAAGPYVPGQVGADRDAIESLYLDRGYVNASVEAVPAFSDDRTRATVTFRIQEGARVFVDHILIVGNVRTRTELIQRELQLKPGDPYSVSAVNESQRRLTLLGLFRRARITEVRHGSENTRDLLVTIEEAPATTIGYGGGVEGKLRRVATESGSADEFQLAPRASFEIGRRNLLGKNRSVNLFTSISANRVGLQPTSTSNSGLTEYRVVGTFREPRFFNTNADAFVNATFEQQLRTGFSFARRSLSAGLAKRVTPSVSVTGNYQLQRTRVFDVSVSQSDQLLIDRTFPKVLLSSFSGSIIRDTRNDPVDPSAGEYASANAQLAAQAIGSAVGFVKGYFTGELFRTIPHASGLVFAGNARLGIANGLTTVNAQGGQSAAAQLPASERFFAGGDTTNRGFALDTLGVRHFPPQPGDTIDQDGLPIGGNGLVILMGELRARVRGSFGLVGFVDTGNVFAKVADIDAREFRTAVGAGIRYRSPVGPLRFDVGFKTNRQPGEGRTAWFVSFGQAF